MPTGHSLLCSCSRQQVQLSRKGPAWLNENKIKQTEQICQPSRIATLMAPAQKKIKLTHVHGPELLELVVPYSGQSCTRQQHSPVIVLLRHRSGVVYGEMEEWSCIERGPCQIQHTSVKGTKTPCRPACTPVAQIPDSGTMLPRWSFEGSFLRRTYKSQLQTNYIASSFPNSPER